MSVVFYLFLIFGTVHSVPFNRLFDHRTTHFEHEQCFFHQADKSGASNGIVQYGVCTSTMGPDGCCLEGHYQPGVCSNLGHICCVKPDYDCSQMKNNKDITRKLLAQQKMMFRRKNSAASTEDEERPSGRGGHRVARSPTQKHHVWHKTNFEVIEMPAHMTLDAVGFVNNALEEYDGNFDMASEHLCNMLDQKYPEATSWACFVGPDYGFSVEAVEGKYMLFYIGNIERIRVMAFASKPPATATAGPAALASTSTTTTTTGKR